MTAGEPRHGARGRRRFLAPEVVQTSGMDCGPAALKSLLEGFRVHVSYGRLREACHTDVDGTSIDTIEDIARQLGADARQVVLPADHVLPPAGASAPAIVVTRTPAGAAHFVVLWRVMGPFVQVMDPARGRLWMSRRAFLDQLFVHSMPVGAKAWRDWAGSQAFLEPLEQRLRALGASRPQVARHLESASADASARGLAALDAATRMVAALRASGGLDASSALAAVDSLVTAAQNDATAIPEPYWSAFPGPADTVRLRGAVLVRVNGLNASTSGAPASADLAAALSEPPVRPLTHVLGALRKDGVIGPAIALCAIGIAAAGVVLEALLLRSVLDVSTLIVRPEQGLAAGLVLAAFAVALLGIEVALASAERRAGSHLEARLRIAFFEKIPRLADLYFQSRPISDMLERSHSLHLLRTLPPLAVRFLRVAAELIVTTIAIAWLDPAVAGLAALAAVAAAGIPLLTNKAVSGVDLKVRTHVGALTRFHLDALLGRTALEAHAAEATIEREHDRRLAEWVRAALSLQRRSTIIEGLQMTIGFGVAAWLLFNHAGAATSGGTLLLMAYWVLNLPALGYELALAAREYPAHRSTILRLLEPLGAPDSSSAESSRHEQAASDIQASATAGAHVELRDVSVSAGGHRILERIDLDVPPGTHVAIVGASGAGKSTLVGVLLGWYGAEAGEVVVDGMALDGNAVMKLRGSTAWVDPTVQLWNRSLLDNLTYGASGDLESMTPVLEAAGLLPVLAKLPNGLATQLGEGGALLSAGEGQRVRLGRAMARRNARLVLLDEPFLGLERDRRRALLTQARQRWSGRTLFYVTHDVSETRAFDRVLVLERGRIAEEGDPHQLAQMPSSRYRRLLQAQEAAYSRLTSGSEWRRLRLDGGRIVQDHGVASLEQRA